jgi:hypothetical protein
VDFCEVLSKNSRTQAEGENTDRLCRASSPRYGFGVGVGEGSGVVADELLLAGAGGAAGWLCGPRATYKITNTTSAATAYQRRLSPKKFIATSRF